MRPQPFSLLVPATFLIAGLAAAAPRPASLPDQALDILKRRCFRCHGGSKTSGLDLRTRASALAGGVHGAGITPGKPEVSPVYTFVAGAGGKLMPPAGPLPRAEQDILKRWIQAGAEWPGGGASSDVWWSLRPLRQPPIPAVKNREWVRNAIDAFVLARLEAEGLGPAPAAGRRELIRRVYFDLTGLPPAPGEVEAFVRDRSPEAYEKVVEHLLASPHYGERWARHWLDIARFAESQGFERDKLREHAWRYRDWVIRSFNEDQPYDRFVNEQVAGDVLPDATRESTIATGFLVAGPYDEVGNEQVSVVMKQRVREDELEDMVAATAQTFLGLTVNCARCHDHKFDPIPQADYYRFQAALAGVKPGDRDLRSQAEREEGDRRAAELRKQRDAAQADLAVLDGRAWQRILQVKRPPIGGEAPEPKARWTFENGPESLPAGFDLKLSGGASVSGGRLILDGKDGQARGALLTFGLEAKTLKAWVVLPDLEQRGGGVMTVEDDAGKLFDSIVFGERAPRRWLAGSDNYRRSQDLEAPDETAGGAEPVHLAVTYHADGRITLYRNGRAYGASYVPEAKLQAYAAGKWRVVLGQRHSDGSFPGNGRWLKGEIEEARLYDRALSAEEVEASFRAGPPTATEAEVREALTSEERERRAKLAAEAERLREEARKAAAPVLAYAAKPEKAPTVKLLKRGDVGQPGDEVSASGLSCLPGLKGDLGLAPDAPDADRRRKLAEWLVDPANPLTPRVIVNRVWGWHFGRGLVGTPSDFGVSGETPTHPELLDYLASVFSAAPAEGETERRRDEGKGKGLGWSLKGLHRLIVTSSTYRQSSNWGAPGPRSVDPRAVDAECHMLWRMPPRRLEAEEIRDAMLAVSGELNRDAGGPGFRAFDVVMANSHFYTYVDKVGPEYNRRSIYRTVVNSGGIPLLETLDCPDPSVKTPRRGSTTTPLQALALLNNSFVLRQAREFAARLEKEAGKDPARQVDRAYQLAFGRQPSRAEGKRAVPFVRTHGLAAFCRVLLNSSEFVYVR